MFLSRFLISNLFSVFLVGAILLLKKVLKNRVTLIGCPKLDAVDYAHKLTAIIANNDIKSVTVVRMEVPCCGGIEQAVRNALLTSGKFIPWQVTTISTDGKILE